MFYELNYKEVHAQVWGTRIFLLLFVIEEAKKLFTLHR